VSARKALAISLQYEEKIRSAIDTVRRDVSQVDWVTEVLRQLDEALVSTILAHPDFYSRLLVVARFELLSASTRGARRRVSRLVA